MVMLHVCYRCGEIQLKRMPPHVSLLQLGMQIYDSSLTEVALDALSSKSGVHARVPSATS